MEKWNIDKIKLKVLNCLYLKIYAESKNWKRTEDNSQRVSGCYDHRSPSIRQNHPGQKFLPGSHLCKPRKSGVAQSCPGRSKNIYAPLSHPGNLRWNPKCSGTFILDSGYCWWNPRYDWRLYLNGKPSAPVERGNYPIPGRENCPFRAFSFCSEWIE